MHGELAIITVVYQNYDVLDNFLKSFEKQTNKNFHIFVSDLSENKKLINSINFPSSIFYLPNRGYAYGINQGLKKAITMGFEKFCVINSDTYVKENFVESILFSMSHNPSSILGGKIYYAPGFEYHKNKYLDHNRGQVIWYAGGIIDWKNIFIKHKGVDKIDKGQFDKFQKTEFITGCFMALDKAVINKIGFWDEKYFLYFEDADFCERAKRANIKLYYDPKIILWHKNAQSTGGSGSKLQQKYQEKNRLKFALKYAPMKTKFFVTKNFLLNKIKGA